MTETLAYIEDYFTNALGEAEKKVFENKCETDDAFAQEVALYALTRQALREELLQQKQQKWKALDAVTHIDKAAPAPVRKINFRQWIAYAAAACILFAVALVYLNGSSTPQQLANNYIEKNIAHIGIEMSASKDSLETGVKFYNDKKYDAALNMFKALDNDLPVSNDAKKYEGFVYLVQKDYDKALVKFDEISKMDLQSNPGAMLKAITLLRRNKEGDKEAAKLLLEKVVNDDKAEGDEDAKKMLDKF